MQLNALGFAPVLRKPPVAEPPEVSGAFQQRRQHRDDSGEHRNSNVNQHHRRTLHELRSLTNWDVTRL